VVIFTFYFLGCFNNQHTQLTTILLEVRRNQDKVYGLKALRLR